MKLDTLQDVFVEQLKDLYSAENQILKALPKLAKTASIAGPEAGLRRTSGADQNSRRPARPGDGNDRHYR